MAVTAFTVAEMVTRITNRTRFETSATIVGELNSAMEWVFNRLFNSEHGQDTLITHATQLTLSSRTRAYDLNAALVTADTLTAGVFGIKKLWVKFVADTNFTPAVALDSADPQFMLNDLYPSADTTTVATGHPVYYDARNFDMVRFAPPLATDTIIRVDYWRKSERLASGTAIAASTCIPEPFYEVIVDKATSQIFTLIDDDRARYWNSEAERKIVDGLNVVQRQIQTPTRTKSYRHSRRWF